jgi:hypothetical protein
MVDSQSLIRVQVTLFVSPQADGGPLLLLVSVQLQSQAEVADASHVAYAVLMADCDWQADSVWSAGHVRNTWAPTNK